MALKQKSILFNECFLFLPPFWMLLPPFTGMLQYAHEICISILYVQMLRRVVNNLSTVLLILKLEMQVHFDNFLSLIVLSATNCKVLASSSLTFLNFTHFFLLLQLLHQFISLSFVTCVNCCILLLGLPSSCVLPLQCIILWLQ